MTTLGPDSSITYDDPTTYVDGQAIAESDISGYEFIFTDSNGASTTYVDPNSEPDVVYLKDVGLVSGSYTFTVRTMHGYTDLSGNPQTIYSDPVPGAGFDYDPNLLKPNPPTNIQLVV